MKITAYNQHDVGSFSRALVCFVTTNLLAATSQRRYAIKRSRSIRERESTCGVEGSLALRHHFSPVEGFAPCFAHSN